MALYDNVMNVAKNYLGIAAEEYIDRRCRISLNIDARSIEKEHLERLADSIGLSATAYLNDAKVANFVKEILALK